jgi:hypothetical protein
MLSVNFQIPPQRYNKFLKCTRFSAFFIKKKRLRVSRETSHPTAAGGPTV